MSIVSLDSYVNDFRNKIGGVRVSSVNANVMNVSRLNSVSKIPPSTKFDFLQSNIKVNINKMIVTKGKHSSTTQVTPVIKVQSINVKSNKEKVFNPILYENIIHTEWKNTMLVDTSYSSKNTVNLDVSEIKIEPHPVKSGGIRNISTSIVSGKYYSISLKSIDGVVKILSVKNLPASLTFDSATSSINGVAFVTGVSVVDIIMSDGNNVVLNINVVPLSLSNGI